jgi:hypothetical protein
MSLDRLTNELAQSQADKLRVQLNYLDLARNSAEALALAAEKATAAKFLGKLDFMHLALNSSDALAKAAENSSAQKQALNRASLFGKAPQADAAPHAWVQKAKAGLFNTPAPKAKDDSDFSATTPTGPSA